MDRVRLSDIVLFGHLGVHEAERTVGQKLNVDVELGCDLEPGARSDHLGDTVDYERVYRLVETLVTGSRFKLIESLARTLCESLLESFPSVQEVTVRVQKPNVPFAGTLSAAEVELTRRR